MPINSQEIQQFSHLEFIARQVVEGFITGLHKSPFHGFSVEFAEHRLYTHLLEVVMCIISYCSTNLKNY